MLKNKIILIFIVLIAGLLRFYQLGTNPPSLTWDEVSWGYNAYSLGIDGKDEFGRFLPYDYLESFGDFKPPMYAYLSIIPVKIFGINEFATRFASAFFGTLTVLVTYFLTKSIFAHKKLEIPIIAAGLLAVSPWHIMLSRAAFEANIATLFLVTGVWLFLLAIHQKPVILFLSVASFVLSMYTFNSARVVAPLLLIGLSIGFFKKLLSEKKPLLLAVIIGLFLILPTTKFLLSPQASLRFKEVNIFSNIELIKTSNQEIANDNNAWWSKIIHNRRVVYSREFIKHYFDNLNPEFLFIKGDVNPKFSTQDVGQMYLLELPFLLLGLLFLFRKRPKNWWIIPLWLIIGIVPAAFARETPHALRIEGTLPVWQILTAFGFANFYFWLNSRTGSLLKFRREIILIVIFAFLINIAYFLHGYYSHYSTEYSTEWQYGYKESINYAQSVIGNYSSVEITSSLGRPYVYALFYSQYEPQIFRKQAKVDRDAFGFVNVLSFGKYKFPKSFSKNKKTLFIVTPLEMPKSVHVLKTFYALNGNPVLVAYEL